MARRSFTMVSALAVGLLLPGCKKASESTTGETTPEKEAVVENAPTPEAAGAAKPVASQSAPEKVREHYEPFDDARMEALKTALNETATGHPFSIPDLTRDERLTLWIQSYKDAWITNWIPFNYKKLHKFDASRPDAEQDARLKAFLDTPSDREHMYQFMKTLSDKQLQTLGY